MERYFAPCPRGLETVLADELERLGAGDIAPADGGVAFAGALELAYRANLESRLASRVLWRVGDGAYRDERDVHALAYSLDWPQWFRADRTLRVDVAATRSPLKSLEFATLRIKDAVCDRHRTVAGKRPTVSKDRPDVRVHAYLTADHATFYLDTSGEPLFKRGYRREAAEAPLRENLAAGLLRLAGWQPGTPLLDPMCGSGTLAIEAAMMALAIPPGHARGFGFERLAGFDARLWKEVRETALARVQAPRKLALFARDRYGEELKKARRNLEAAGLAPCVELKQADVLDTGAPAGAGVLVANPPYGARLGEDKALAEFYPKLGDTLKKFYAGWRCYLFSADSRLPKLLHLQTSRRTPLFNGPLECRLYEYKIVAGSMRKERAE